MGRVMSFRIRTWLLQRLFLVVAQVCSAGRAPGAASSGHVEKMLKNTAASAAAEQTAESVFKSEKWEKSLLKLKPPGQTLILAHQTRTGHIGCAYFHR